MASVWASWLMLTSILAASILSDALHRERGERAFSDAQHAGFAFAEIDHRAGLHAARSSVDDEVALALEERPDLAGIGQWFVVSRQHERGGKHRLVELGEQRVGHRVPGHAHADRLLARKAPRHFLSGTQDERVAARRHALQELELRVVDHRVARHLGEIAAHQRQVMALVDTANAAQALGPFRAGAVAAQRIARVRRIGDQAAVAHDFGGLAHQALLRVRRMDGEILRHQRARNSSSSRATASGWSWCSMCPASATVTWRRLPKAARRSAGSPTLSLTRWGVCH